MRSQKQRQNKQTQNNNKKNNTQRKAPASKRTKNIILFAKPSLSLSLEFIASKPLTKQQQPQASKKSNTNTNRK